MSDGSDRRLAVYGTLAPGKPNHHQLAPLGGRWTAGRVHGHLVAHGWASYVGYPALILDTAGPEVDVMVMESDELAAHWARLDTFEGAGYSRVATPVETDSGVVTAQIYVHDPTDDPSTAEDR